MKWLFAALMLSLAIGAAGCMEAILGTAPTALSATKVMAAGTGSNATAKDDNGRGCGQLVRHAPGVEEIRMPKDGSGELAVREWTLGNGKIGAQWRVVYVRGASQSGWKSETLTDLHFQPPLDRVLAPGESRYLVYTPSDPETIAEGDQLAATAVSFGPSVGTFQWRGRSYDYSLASRLPCFPAAN